MFKPDHTNIEDAFDLLLSELQHEIKMINESGASAMAGGDYDNTRSALDKANRIDNFKEKVEELREAWKNINLGVSPSKKKRGRPPKKELKTAKRGIRTPEKDFYLPILQVIEDEGGSAETKYVVKKVGHLMASILTPGDRQPVKSNPQQPRWNNTVRWARNSLKVRELLKNDSPRGLWEISITGRSYLKSNRR